MTKQKLNSLEQSQAAKRMNLAAWRASHLHEMTLPSGLNVIVRDVTMTDLMLTGELPENILDMAQEMSNTGEQSIDLKQIAKNGSEFNKMLISVMKLSLVSPKIGDETDDEHILLAELSGDDKMAIFNWVNREVPQIKSFREGESEPLANVQHGDSLRKKAESVPAS